MWHRVLGGVLFVLVIGSATQCSSSDGASCDTAKCSMDPKPIVGTVQQCLDIQKGPCGSQYKDERSCLADKWQCTGDGHLDPNSQVTALAACQMKTKAYQDCIATSGDGG